MYRQPVISSNLASVGYEAATHTLEIEFQNGRVYRYAHVPESIYQGLMAAASKGSYFADFIKDLYPFIRVL